jgi:hypothetical protein
MPLAYHIGWEETLRKRRYIHLNPVRADIVEHADDYLYSSARFYYNRKCLIDLAEK